MSLKGFQAVLIAAIVLAIPGFAQEKPNSSPWTWGSHLGPQPPSGGSIMIDWTRNAAMAENHAGWKHFVEAHPGWIGVFDPRDGNPIHAYGPGLPVTRAEPSSSDIQAAAVQFRDEVLPLLGQDPATFEFKAAQVGGSIWYVHFNQHLAGARVIGSRFLVRIDTKGRLVAFSTRFFDLSGIELSPAVSPDVAKSLAKAHLMGLGFVTTATQLTEHELERTIYVRETDTALEKAVSAYRIVFMADQPRADWNVYVDASTGLVVDFWNDLRECEPAEPTDPTDPTGITALLKLAAINGAVTGTVHEGVTPQAAPVMRSFRDITVTCNGTNVTTDALGNYAFNGGGATIPVTSLLDGPWINGTSLTLTLASFSGTAAAGLFDVAFTDVNSNVGQRDMVYFTNKGHAYMKTHAPTLTQLDTPITGNANSTAGTCNAFYSPAAHSINFYAAGGGCINTATSSNVVVHEYGHGVTTRVYQSFGFSVPGYMGEGLSDCQGAAVDDSNLIGLGFQGAGTIIRNLDNTCQYPTSCGTEVHARGQLIGACYWHTRVQFANAFGAAGKFQMDGYLYRHLLGSPQNEIDSCMDMLVQDDNDANLANGTPNVGKFYQGFTVLHAVPFPIQLVAVTHAPLHDTLDQFQPYEVRCTVSSITGQALTAVQLFWRNNPAAAYTATTMSLLGGEYRATIPNQPSGTRVEYYIRSTDAGGTQGFSPVGAPAAANSFGTSISNSFFVDGFEVASGWTHAIIANGFTNQDDWQNNVLGSVTHLYDPHAPYQGLRMWGNDLSPVGSNGNYANNVWNQLTSPLINCTGRTGVHLVYRRWLTVEDGFYDHARILVSNNNGASYTQVWTNPTGTGTQHFLDTAWNLHDLDISALANNQAQVRIRFELQTDAGLTFGGWTIDDLKLTAANIGAGTILTSSGSSAVGQIYNVHVNGAAGDIAYIGLEGSIGPNYFPGVGTLSVNPLSPSFFLILPGIVVPAGGTYTLPISVPNVPGVTVYFQGLLAPAVSPANFIISNVLVTTITP